MQTKPQPESLCLLLLFCFLLGLPQNLNSAGSERRLISSDQTDSISEIHSTSTSSSSPILAKFTRPHQKTPFPPSSVLEENLEISEDEFDIQSLTPEQTFFEQMNVDEIKKEEPVVIETVKIKTRKGRKGLRPRKPTVDLE